MTASARYYFLSYAHTPPVPGVRNSDDEHWVSELHRDLGDRVQHYADPTSGLDAGFCEAGLPPSADRNAALEEALARAAVFVPLYSPHYFSKRWPQREIRSYRRRLAGLDEYRQQRRIIPVLWLPFPSWQRDQEIDRAISFGHDVSQYAEDGLRALRTLRDSRASYDEIVDRLARAIVAVAEGEPLEPTRLPMLLDDAPQAGSGEAPLVVTVVAPESGDLPAGAPRRAYGQDARSWTPFTGPDAVPAAELVLNVAERFSLRVWMRDLPAQARPDYRFPTVLLVDPWILATPVGGDVVRRAIEDAPQWVTPLVLVDRSDAASAAAIAPLETRLRALLPTRGDNRARWAGDAAEFAAVTPDLVAVTCRHYRQHAAVFAPKTDPEQNSVYPRSPRRGGSPDV